MPITPHNLVRHELIGLAVKIATSTDKTQRGMSGRVVDESYNTLRIEVKGGEERTVIKQNNVFIFTLPNKVKVQVNGRLLVARPEDRIKKKLPKW